MLEALLTGFHTLGMMKYRLAAVTAITLMSAPLSSQTAPAKPPVAAAAPRIPTRISAQTLTVLCGQDRSACLTYVLGTADAFSAALVASGRPQSFCFPAGTTNDQIAQSAVAYLRAHPEEAKTNAALVVLAGLKARFPCGY